LPDSGRKAQDLEKRHVVNNFGSMLKEGIERGRTDLRIGQNNDGTWVVEKGPDQK